MKAIIKKNPITAQPWNEGMEVKEKPEPQIQNSADVKIKVVAASICGTDVSIYKSTDALRESMSHNEGTEVIVGHEFCGQITNLGKEARQKVAETLYLRPVKNLAINEFLTKYTKETLGQSPDLLPFLSENFYASAEMHIVCWTCRQCCLGEGHVCQNTKIKGLHQDGAFSEYVVVPASNLLLFEKDEIPPQIIAFMDAIGNAAHTVQAAEVAGKSLLITGAGIQGLMSIAIARQMGAGKIFLTDASDEKRGLSAAKLQGTKFALAKKLGVDECFDVGDEAERKALAAAIAKATDSTGVDAVLEMSGSYHALDDGLQYVRKGGIIALLGLPSGKKEIDFSRDIIFRGVTLKGIAGRRMFSTWELMRKLLTEGLAQKILDNGIISHDLPLADFEKGFEAIFAGDAYKVILRP